MTASGPGTDTAPARAAAPRRSDPEPVPTGRAMWRGRSRVVLLHFAVTTFASAFLIFLVQPVVGKRILPWFGGVPAVWMLCLAFYQVTLFLGYAYAHGLARLAPPRLQLPLHAVVFVAALLCLPVLPGEAWRPGGGGGPSGSIVVMLAANVGAPFLFLAGTGPLVQAWFAARFPSRSPYPLYAVSNLGSLVAVLGYPFLLEPRLPLSTTGRLWTLAFAVTGIAVLACAHLGTRGRTSPAAMAHDAIGAADEARPARTALWLLLPACAVMLLMGITNELCLDVASVPFLWTLPLGVYLATFILCFGSERAYRRAPFVLVAAACLLAPSALRWLAGGNPVADALLESVHARIAWLCLLLFASCMVLHGELYRLRPPPRRLTAFYLCVSAGGAMGGLFVGLAAPRLFHDYHELRLGLVLAALLLLAACWEDSRGLLHRGVARWRWGVAVAGTLAAIVLLGAPPDGMPGVVYQERTFFGVLRVLEFSSGPIVQRQLASGATMHGVQIMSLEREPTSYYGRQTGIGLALGAGLPDRPVRIGIIGLGIGTLATYGRAGDEIRFYEIDPGVIRIARERDFFTFLSSSPAAIEIVEGDGRISLADDLARGAPRLDVLVIDAFTSDSIPVHLLTREAFALYRDAIAERGLLAVHASNRHLDLLPVVARGGLEVGLHALAIENRALPRHRTGQASWMFLSPDPARLEQLVALAEARREALRLPPTAIVARPVDAAALAGTPLWTDDYSDLLGALRPLRILR